MPRRESERQCLQAEAVVPEARAQETAQAADWRADKISSSKSIRRNMPSLLSNSANQFGVELFQCYLSRHKHKNLLLCPYLIYHSLAMMLVGAKGKTATQLIRLLRIPSNLGCASRRAAANRESSVGKSRQLTPDGADEPRHREFLMLTEQLIHGNHDFVHLASFIYLDKGTKRSERFKAILRDYYETKPKKMDFENVELIVKTVNEDVKRTTENIYSEIMTKIEAQKLEKSYMLLVNAVFFRGFWLSNFTEVKRSLFVKYELSKQQATATLASIQPQSSSSNLHQNASASASVSISISSSSFSSTQSSPTSAEQTAASQEAGNRLQTKLPIEYSVNMMSKLDYLPVLTDDHLEARIIRMPFEASDLQMLLFLPNNRQSDSTYLCNKLSASKISSIVDEFAKSRSKIVRVSMPVFCIDSGKISLQSTLVTMGAGDLFDSARANMRGVCENKQIWLHKILHRCFIVCDNRGSITSSSLEKAKRRQAKLESGISTGRSGVEDFVADHPFMYIIMDSKTKTILLIGLYTDPNETIEIVHENQLSPEECHKIFTEGVYKT